MGLRLSEGEYAEFLRKNKQRIAPKPDFSGRVQAAPTCCQPARASCACLEDMDERPKRLKYGNRRVEVDGIKFDSRHEASYYFGVLIPRVKNGELRSVLRQVKFDLPGGIVYIADFVTILPDMRIESVIDAKSEATRKNRVYINKKKQMLACWGIEILEV